MLMSEAKQAKTVIFSVSCMIIQLVHLSVKKTDGIRLNPEQLQDMLRQNIVLQVMMLLNLPSRLEQELLQ